MPIKFRVKVYVEEIDEKNELWRDRGEPLTVKDFDNEEAANEYATGIAADGEYNNESGD